MKTEDIVEHLILNNISPSSITDPQDGTIVYIAKKIEHNLVNLVSANGCFVLCENGINVSDELQKKHTFYFVDNPSLVFAKYAERREKRTLERRNSRDYKTLPGNVTIGENVVFGNDIQIGRNVFIDHDVYIGDQTIIRDGACIYSNVIIGKECFIGDQAIIGNLPFGFSQCDYKQKRVFPLGNIKLSDFVEVGAHSIVDMGTISTTQIGENTKIDVFVHIGHDAKIGKNVLVTTTSSLGAFSTIGDNTRVYSSKVMKRIFIGRNATIDFGSVVYKNIADNAVVIGCPARELPKAKNEL